MSAAFADAVPYRSAPSAIETILRAPVLPSVLIAPTGETRALATPLRYPPVADLARPMLRLAGLRIDPQTNGIHHAVHDDRRPVGAVHGAGGLRGAQ